MKTQNEEVLEHLQKFDGITSMQAFGQYGITRLSGRIFELRQRGHDIKSRYKVVTSRSGKKTHVTEYYLVGNQEGDT